jgi:hypothetical protein
MFVNKNVCMCLMYEPHWATIEFVFCDSNRTFFSFITPFTVGEEMSWLVGLISNNLFLQRQCMICLDEQYPSVVFRYLTYSYTLSF